MAFINVKNGVVGKLNSKGFTLVESYTKDGETRSTYFKVWTAEPVNTGDVVSVSGIYSARIEEYEGQARLSININSPKITRETVASKPDANLPF